MIACTPTFGKIGDEIDFVLANGRVIHGVMGDEKTKKDAFAALKSAAGYIKKEVSKRLNLRQTPDFTFVEDDSIEYGAHIEELLKNL